MSVEIKRYRLVLAVGSKETDTRLEISSDISFIG